MGTSARQGEHARGASSGTCTRTARKQGRRKGKEERRRKEEKKREKEKEEEREKKEREEKEKRSAAGFAAGGRAWATGSRAARDGTAVRKKRESEVRSVEK